MTHDTVPSTALAPAPLRRLWTATHLPAPDVRPWARAAALLVPLLVLPSSLWRVAGVTLHLPIVGGLAQGRGNLPGWLPLELYVVLLSVASELLAFTAVGLVSTWGERVPAWVPRLGGRRIPRAVAAAPAALGALALTALWTVSFTQIVRGRTIQGDPLRSDFVLAQLHTWRGALALAAYAPLVLWGPLLGAVTVAYWRRRGRWDGAVSGTGPAGRAAPGPPASGPARRRA